MNKLSLEVITPVFIGGDTINNYAASDYFIKGNKAYMLKPSKLLRAYQEFNNKSVKESVEYFMYFFQQVDNNRIDFNVYNELFTDEFKEFIINKQLFEYTVKLSSEFINSYRDKHLQEVNSFIKSLNKPFIPGSSIKGAIRTAILNKRFHLNEFNSIYNLKDFNKKIDELLKNRIGHLMRFINISDFLGVSCNNLFIHTIKKGSKIPISAEFLEKGSRLTGSIIVNEKFGQDFKSLINDCNEFTKFYLAIVKERWSDDVNKSLIENHLQLINDNPKSMFLIIGKYNGWFSKTISKVWGTNYFREVFIKLIRDKKSNYRIFPKTIGLINKDVIGLIKISL